MLIIRRGETTFGNSIMIINMFMMIYIISLNSICIISIIMSMIIISIMCLIMMVIS